MRAWFFAGALCTVSACASTVAPQRPDRARSDAAIGLNPDGDDPFARADARSDAGVDVDPDGGAWVLPDGQGIVEDQRYGVIRLGTYNGGGSLTAYAMAEFRNRYRPDDPRCVSSVTGRFGTYQCDESMSPPRDTHPVPFPQAGIITFAHSTGTPTLRPGNDGRYSTWTANGPDEIFALGSVVTINALGGTVPRWTQMISIPPAFQARVIGAGGDVIRRDQGVTIEWDAPTNTRWVWIYIQQSPTVGGRTLRVQLSVEAYPDERRVVFPPSVLRGLVASETERVTITAYPYNTVEFRAGDWPITIWAVGPSQPVSMRVQ